MVEITRNVYDIFHPTPVSLKELSAITVSLKIWLSQVIQFRSSGTSEDFDIFLPDLPSTIRNIIYKFSTRFSVSMNHWQQSHYQRIFQFHRPYQNSVLEDFDDFVVDFDGSIQYVRTAERMMRSDRLGEAEKFKIACTYFFEDDIMRIWPSVCESLDLNDVNFDTSPQVYYWVCYLRNQLDKLQIRSDERMFDYCMPYNRRSVEYLWARVPLECQLRIASVMYWREVVSFVRFILPKLDDQQLGEFVNTKARQLMRCLWESGFAYEWLWLPTWMHIKNKMNQNTVSNVVLEMLKFENGAFTDHSKSEPKNWLDFCSAVWHSIPSDWKRSMMKDILSDIRFFKDMSRWCNASTSCINCGLSCTRFVNFLLIILSSANSELKSDFWHKCWPHLIKRTRCEDLQQMMKLCLDNEDEIAKFIDNIMANSDCVRKLCVKLLKEGLFNSLNDLVDFCYPETQKGMNFKQQLLRTTLHLKDSSYGVAFLGIIKKDLSGFKELTTFIDSAFENIDLSAAFKNELMSSHLIRENLPCSACWSSVIIDTFIELIETFVTSKQNLKDIKALTIRRLITDLRCARPSLDHLLIWCLESEKEVADFKQRYLTSNQIKSNQLYFLQ
ncbi:uncharacterized protein LOC135839424 [Planococcus citri]|uniref:uncharacterized protein LOC135839424 n=1 Tax=Planococcus citri TaxID=170843 RepID=UPI0031F8964F